MMCRGDTHPVIPPGLRVRVWQQFAKLRLRASVAHDDIDASEFGLRRIVQRLDRSLVSNVNGLHKDFDLRADALNLVSHLLKLGRRAGRENDGFCIGLREFEGDGLEASNQL